MLRRRSTLPAAVVWVEAPPYRPGRAYVDQLELAEPQVVAIGRGDLELVRRSLNRALAADHPLRDRFRAFHAGGAVSREGAVIERNSHDTGFLETPVSADEDRRLLSLPPPFSRLLYELVVETQPGICLELGTAHGVSGLHLAAGLGEDGELVTVEVDPVRRRLAVDAISELLPDARVTSVEGRFPDCLPSILDRLRSSLGLVFEDGPHRLEVTLGCFELVRDHVRPGGLYIVDDVRLPGNDEAWATICADRRVTAWVELNGRLGICRLD